MAGKTYDFNSDALTSTIFARKSTVHGNVYKGIPAKIVGIGDYSTLQCVDVQIAIEDIFMQRDDLEFEEAITIKKVFVALPRWGEFRVESPVELGQPVRLQWGHRDLGNYLDSDGVNNVSLSIDEVAMLEDCWCTLDGGTRKNNNNPSTDNLVLRNKNFTKTYFKNGNITEDTSGTVSTSSAGNTHKAPLTTIDGDLHVTGNMTIEGTLTVGGVATFSAGALAASYAGISGGNMVTVGTVVIGGVEVNNHYHVDAEGRNTGPMVAPV